MSSLKISETIDAWIGDMPQVPHHRSRSWDHCYAYFQDAKRSGLKERRDEAAIQLGFYLASWGMYRGSSFLLQNAYTIHQDVIEVLASSDSDILWHNEIGWKDDRVAVEAVLRTAENIRDAYRAFGNATDTLVTKVLLGTVACVPALDRYFLDGFKDAGFKGRSLNRNWMEQLVGFCRENAVVLRNEQARIKRKYGFDYPAMKLVDMYFNQRGFELEK